jgi:hypothetical protein
MGIFPSLLLKYIRSKNIDLKKIPHQFLYAVDDCNVNGRVYKYNISYLDTGVSVNVWKTPRHSFHSCMATPNKQRIKFHVILLSDCWSWILFAEPGLGATKQTNHRQLPTIPALQSQIQWNNMLVVEDI